MSERITEAWPKFSIVMPSFNHGRYITDAIESVLGQDYPHKELIVIDGGSTDGAVDVLRRYDKRLAYWVSEKDRGNSHAINKGFRRATGDVVAWLNSDDMYPAGALSAVAAEFRRDPTLDFVYGNMYRIDKEGKVFGEKRYAKVWPIMIPLMGMVLPQLSAFWKRDLFDRVGYLDETQHFCDLEFTSRLAWVTKRSHIRKFTAMFRVHGDQKSYMIQDVGKQEFAALQEAYKKKLGGPIKRRLLRWWCQAARLWFFTVQGDMDYVLRGYGRGRDDGR